MLSFFRRDPIKKIEREYAAMLERARDAQRAGDIKLFAQLSGQADDLAQRLEELRRQKP